ncbi:hypothetical protein Tco_1064612 [Tanacetum coccineum]
MRELVVKYKAEKVCHDEMVKMPLVDLKVLEFTPRREVEFRIELVRGATPIAKAVSFNVYGDERVVGIVARAARDDGWSYFGVDIGRPSTIWERANVVVDAWSRKGGVKPRQGCRMAWTNKWRKEMVVLVNEAVARHGVNVSSIPDKDGMYIKVLERDVEVVRNTIGILTFREVSFPTKIVIIRVFEVFSLEVLYRRRGRSPVLYAEIRESKMIGLELEQETTKVVVIKERPKEAKDRQES